ncbi:MAG TPA: ClpXP protease specificity-enhancing factor SspB [Thermoanaerobaculia bacterium]|nr:ClpXP protease specificity-enhancing factor SspB [Thermoanaerobaculia bacterium]
MSPPPPPAFDYRRWIAESLRHVVRRALEQVAAEGLPPEHHFLVSFASAAPGVVLPAFLRERYPEEITVVLENQFWDLVADEEGFSVTLAFAGSRQRVFAPWPAVTAFADPGAQLALRFVPADGEEAETGAEEEAAEVAGGEEKPPAETGSGAGEVVRLDRFRRRREGDPEAS